jgi:hypothetical protein
MEVMWENHVYSVFRKGEDSVTAKRQRAVALALATKKEGATPEQIPSLSFSLASMYARVTHRTLYRDLGHLRALGLIVPRDGRWVANMELVRAFLPLTGSAKSS